MTNFLLDLFRRPKSRPLGLTEGNRAAINQIRVKKSELHQEPAELAAETRLHLRRHAAAALSAPYFGTGEPGFGKDPYAILATELEKHDITESDRTDFELQGAFNRQVGGSHYRDTAMQPFHFTLTNGWDGGAHTILKYIARHEAKGGREDLDKAIHVVDIRLELLPDKLACDSAEPRGWGVFISMNSYCDINGYTGLKKDALLALARWVYNPAHQPYAEQLKREIAAYRDIVYPM